MEPEAREYCVTEALPKLAPKERKKLTWRDACLVIQTLAAIASYAQGNGDNDRTTQQQPPAPPAAIVQQAEMSADRLQSEDNSFLIFDDSLQAVDGSRESPDLVGQEATVDGQGGSED